MSGAAAPHPTSSPRWGISGEPPPRFAEGGVKSSSPPPLAGEGREGAGRVSLQPVTHLARIGLKGPNAMAWLQQHGIATPADPNTWCPTSDDEQDINVRLGAGEFLLEQTDGHALRKLNAELATYVPGVYPVLREDRAFVLSGENADDVLAQMCNVNFAALRAEAREAVMTLMIGVAVTVVPQGKAAHRRYRIWCDPSYGDYLWSSLQDVAQPTLTDTTKALGGIR